MLKEKDYYKLVFGTALVLITIFAFMDVQGFNMWNKVGGYPGETYAVVGDDYASFFWSFATLTTLAVSLMFYYFRRDISEALGVLVVTWLLLLGGLEDIIYYVLWGGSVPLAFDWLFANTHLGWVARLLGHSTLTWGTLFLQLIVFTYLAYVAAKYLKGFNMKIGGVNL